MCVLDVSMKHVGELLELRLYAIEDPSLSGKSQQKANCGLDFAEPLPAYLTYSFHQAPAIERPNLMTEHYRIAR